MESEEKELKKKKKEKDECVRTPPKPRNHQAQSNASLHQSWEKVM